MITTPLSKEAAEQLKKEASNMQDNREKLLQSITEALQELNTDALQLIDRLFIQTIKGSERYSINTPEERLEELKATSAKDKAYKEEQAAKQQTDRATFNTVPLYDRNETMKLIGYSHYSTFVAPSAEYGGGFCDIIQAYKYDCCSKSLFSIGLDFFIYGMICGIKEQRKRAKRARV